MAAVSTALTAAFFCIAAGLATLLPRSCSTTGTLMLLLPAIALVYVVLTFYRFSGAPR